MKTATVADALRHAAAQGVDRLDAQRLLVHALGCADRSWLLAHDDAPLSIHATQQWEALLARYQSGEPMGYLLGVQEFHGLALHVDSRVLVPRPDTETLVDWVLEALPTDGPLRVLDLGTGSGAIALALQARCPRWHVWATDASPDALAVAQSNAQQLGLRLGVTFCLGDWYQALPVGVAQEGFDAIVSNPPYIAEGDPHWPALRKEPAMALRGGKDGLDALRKIVDGAPAYLRRGGWLLLEHGYDQGEAMRNLLRAQGMAMVSTRRDLAGNERCTGGQAMGAS